MAKESISERIQRQLNAGEYDATTEYQDALFHASGGKRGCFREKRGGNPFMSSARSFSLGGAPSISEDPSKAKRFMRWLFS